MRKELRAQLRRHKERPRFANRLWSRATGITIPWTVGQRKWQKRVIRDSLNTVMARMYVESLPDRIVVSKEWYDAFQEERNRVTKA